MPISFLETTSVISAGRKPIPALHWTTQTNTTAINNCLANNHSINSIKNTSTHNTSGQVQLWQFLLELLSDQSNKSCIIWEGEFFLDSAMIEI